MIKGVALLLLFQLVGESIVFVSGVPLPGPVVGLVLLFAVKYFGRKGLVVIAYNVALWFAVVYLANHWVVDILAGIAWATLAFVLVDWGWDRVLHRGGSAATRVAPGDSV